MRVVIGVSVGVAVAVAGLVGVRLPAEALSGGRGCAAPDQAPGFESRARSGVVPQVRCMDLELARYKARAAGFTQLRWEDASGAHRRPIEYRNWVVLDQAPAAGTAASSRTRILFRVLAYGDRGAPPVPDRTRRGRIPKLVCFNLREAEATLDSAGFIHVDSEDASGRGRHQIIRSNWTVTGQMPPAGGTWSKSTRITLRVVKQSERSACP